VRVSLCTADGTIELVVEDNGAGFDWKAALAPDRGRKGFGLASMRERTEFSGGAFAVEAINGTTVIRASWPRERVLAMSR
jgi:signal transduction histidine kinase